MISHTCLICPGLTPALVIDTPFAVLADALAEPPSSPAIRMPAAATDPARRTRFLELTARRITAVYNAGGVVTTATRGCGHEQSLNVQTSTLSMRAYQAKRFDDRRNT